ncbi:unnamed protein product [Closterium sp. Yama58-4]|nr:unnamed protein product [Closterium sp. Yama58-4]
MWCRSRIRGCVSPRFPTLVPVCPSNNPPDAVDMLPAPIWFRIFHLLHQPPSQPDDAAIFARKEEKTETGSDEFETEEESEEGEEDEDGKVRLPEAEAKEGGKTKINADISETEDEVEEEAERLDAREVEWFRTPGLSNTRTSDHLTNTKVDRDRPPVVFREEGLTAREQHKDNADTYGASSSPRSRRLHRSKQPLPLVPPPGVARLSHNQGNHCWTLGFLTECAQLRELNLGRGKWSLNKQCVNAAWFKSIRKLTLEQVDFGSLSFQFLQSITPQLHEFTLYEDGNGLREDPRFPFSTSRLAFAFPNARLLRFRFANTGLHLTLSVSPAALKTLSVMAKRLVLSCKSTAPLALDHLSLYCQEHLDISSLCLASARVAYLDGPASHQEGFSWTEWLSTIAPTVEVLIVRHGVPIKKVHAEWGRLWSLGIVVPPWEKNPYVKDWRMVTDEGGCEEHLDDGRLRNDDPGYFDLYGEEAWALYGPAVKARMRARRRLSKAVFKPPSICAPNLRFLFFPTRKACNASTLAALRQDYPALALYCVVDRSLYWERKGQPVSHGPLKHVRRAKSGVWDEEKGGKRAKNVREKMHSVNRRVVEGYCAEEDQAYVLQYQQK